MARSKCVGGAASSVYWLVSLLSLTTSCPTRAPRSLGDASPPDARTAEDAATAADASAADAAAVDAPDTDADAAASDAAVTDGSPPDSAGNDAAAMDAGGVLGGGLLWAKQAGGEHSDQMNSVAAGVDGSFVTCGSFGGTAIFGPGEPNQTILVAEGVIAGGPDAFVARYEANGTLSWARRISADVAQHAESAVALPDGSVVVGGNFYGTVVFGPGEPGQITLTSAGESDSFLARWNPDGSPSWAIRDGGASTDLIRAVSVCEDDSLWVGGGFAGTATFGAGQPGETVLGATGVVDAFIARYQADGTLIWARSIACDDRVSVHATATAPDGGLWVAGGFSNTATFGSGEAGETLLVSEGEADLFVARYDPDGSLQWARRGGGTSLDSAQSLAVLGDDSVIVVGGFRDTATFGAGAPGETTMVSAGSVDAFAIRYGPTGALQWARRAGGGVGDAALGVASLPDDSALITGIAGSQAVFGPGEAGETLLDGRGVFIARYRPDGTLLWAKHEDGSLLDMASAVAVSPTGTAAVAGYFEHTTTFGPGEETETVLTTFGYRDAFLAAFAP